jgi:hypothetical protein
MERWRVASGDEKAFGAQQPCGDLAPWLSLRMVNEAIALAFELYCSSFDVGDLELDGRLGHWHIRGPLLLPEAGLRCF